MDMAELLKPSFSLEDNANVMTLSRGYSRPMPPPAEIHPAMTTAAGQWNAAVARARATAPRTISAPMLTARRWDSLLPSRPWTADAPAQANAPPVRVRPAKVGEKAYCSISRYGR
jgi:hypothetical protein